MKRKQAFTLVVLLVVIGIIALLISILLPSLMKARRAAQTVQCLSNLRQLSLAAVQFANDHKGFVQTTTDYNYVIAVDKYRQRYEYRDDGTLKDWASALLPYLGGKKSDDFSTAGSKQTKVFQCPSDRWLDDPAPGYGLVNNIANSAGLPAP